MSSISFNTDSFRDSTFDLLSGISRDATKFDEVNDTYIKKIHERTDADDLKKYTKDIYEKICCKKKNVFFLNLLKRKFLFDYLALQIVQANSGVQLKDSIQEKTVIIYIWTFSDIHSSHMMQKIIGIDKRYSTSDVSCLNIE